MNGEHWSKGVFDEELAKEWRANEWPQGVTGNVTISHSDGVACWEGGTDSESAMRAEISALGKRTLAFVVAMQLVCTKCCEIGVEDGPCTVHRSELQSILDRVKVLRCDLG